MKSPERMNLAGPEALAVSAKEAAKMLAISTRTLWSMTASGEIPFVRIRSRVLYLPDDLREWLQRQRQGGDR